MQDFNPRSPSWCHQRLVGKCLGSCPGLSSAGTSAGALFVLWGILGSTRAVVPLPSSFHPLLILQEFIEHLLHARCWRRSTKSSVYILGERWKTNKEIHNAKYSYCSWTVKKGDGDWQGGILETGIRESLTGEVIPKQSCREMIYHSMNEFFSEGLSNVCLFYLTVTPWKKKKNTHFPVSSMMVSQCLEWDLAYSRHSMISALHTADEWMNGWMNEWEAENLCTLKF